MRFNGLTLVAVPLSIFISACSSPKSGSLGIPVFPPTLEGPAELAYCGTPITYSGSTVTVTGTAEFQYRKPYGTSSSGGLDYVESTPKPVRYAEVRVVNSVGTVSQCSETNSTGDFSFVLPKDDSTYVIYVNSRADNSYLKATVFDQPENKQFYSLSTSVRTDQDRSVGSLIASATDNLYAGAFNILDQIALANDYLRTQVGSCSAVITDCPDFTVAPKVEVFWRKGFNPGSYYNSGGLSFYLPGYSRMFILGGINGNTDTADTDHFDNSVIIHEYGHFLEDQVFASDSPGGSHNGNRIIDPRLAWSEGWGNFLQAAVQDSPYYIDTVGNRDGTTSFGFYVGLETAVAGRDLPQDGPGGMLGEGNFREFSVTRLLWDAVDTNDDSETITDGFPEIWASLLKADGWKKATAAFRSIGWFHMTQASLVESTDWSSIITKEKQVPDRREYAQYVDITGGCTGYNFDILPQSVSGDVGTFSTSDLYRNNNFYHIYVPTARSNVSFRLVYEDEDGSGVNADLDLYLYNSNARFGYSADWVGYSRVEPSGSAGTPQYETISLASLPAGHYLLNVFVYTGQNIGGLTEYKIEHSYFGQSSANLCVSTLP